MLLGFRIAFFKVTESESLAVTFTAWYFKSEYFSALHFYRIFIIKCKLFFIHYELLFKPHFLFFQVRKKLLKMMVLPAPRLENCLFVTLITVHGVSQLEPKLTFTGIA